MDLSNIPFDDIKAEHIEQIVAEGIPEGHKYLEYKSQLPGRSDGVEFLADMSSFANTAGGDVLFGITENAGIPVEIPGLPGINADAEVLRLDNILRDGVRPRLIGVRGHATQLVNDKVVIHYRIPKSWSPPHMVTLNQNMRIYGRNSNGKYTLDVEEIRPLFALTTLTTEKLDAFRFNRLLKIKSEELPIQLHKSPTVITHVIPMGAFSEGASVDLSAVYQDGKQNQLASIGGSFITYNFDGALFAWHTQPDNVARRVLSIFRNGICEFIDSAILIGDRIDGTGLELSILKSVTRMLKIQKTLGLGLPVLIGITLANVNETNIYGQGNISGRLHSVPIDRSEILIPPSSFESPDVRLDFVLKSSFDLIWSAGGWPKSPNYENDEWCDWHAQKSAIDGEDRIKYRVW